MTTMGNMVVNDHKLGGLLIHDTPNLILYHSIIFADQRKTDRQSMLPISIVHRVVNGGWGVVWTDKGGSRLLFTCTKLLFKLFTPSQLSDDITKLSANVQTFRF